MGKTRLEELREKYKEPDEQDEKPWRDVRSSRINRRYLYAAINTYNHNIVDRGDIVWDPRPEYEQRESEYGNPVGRT